LQQTKLNEFDLHRGRLFGIAYRMTGSVMDAEDILQDAFVRWQNAGQVDTPKSFLTTMVTRMCIDFLRSAQVRREEYVGTWLPEPLITEPATDSVALAESLSMAFLRVLESLSPTERAVFLLREVFDYDYDEIAQIIETRESNCRQIFKRAKDHIATNKPRFKATREKHFEILSKFGAAVWGGDLNGLVKMLAEDATLYSDGGGKVRAAIHPIRSGQKVARFLIGIQRKMPPDLMVEFAEINGAIGVLCRSGGKIFMIVSIDTVDDIVRGVYLVLNPDKLGAR
jgi:RNA polymerase sigma-70 factor (ECF subfamily)